MFLIVNSMLLQIIKQLKELFYKCYAIFKVLRGFKNENI